MKNHQFIVGEKALSLPELKAKEAELDAALKEVRSFIQALERFEKSGVMSGKAAPSLEQSSLFDIANMSVYEGAVSLLEERNKILTTDEIVEALIQNGKNLGKNARMIVATLASKPDSVSSTSRNFRMSAFDGVVCGSGFFMFIPP